MGTRSKVLAVRTQSRWTKMKLTGGSQLHFLDIQHGNNKVQFGLRTSYRPVEHLLACRSRQKSGIESLGNIKLALPSTQRRTCFCFHNILCYESECELRRVVLSSFQKSSAIFAPLKCPSGRNT